MHELRHPPRQFNYRLEWQRLVRPFHKTPAGITALRKLTERYYDIADFKYEEMARIDPEYALEELDVDRHKAEVCVKDVYWLEEVFGGGYEIAEFSLALAESIYPEDQWALVEKGDYFVVTNEKRSLVFDMERYEQLSASASLLLVGIVSGPESQSAHAELEEYFEKRQAEHEARIDGLRKTLQDAQGEGVLEFRKNTPEPIA